MYIRGWRPLGSDEKCRTRRRQSGAGRRVQIKTSKAEKTRRDDSRGAKEMDDSSTAPRVSQTTAIEGASKVAQCAHAAPSHAHCRSTTSDRNFAIGETLRDALRHCAHRLSSPRTWSILEVRELQGKCLYRRVRWLGAFWGVRCESMREMSGGLWSGGGGADAGAVT
jgi:hypothetical protein